MNTTIRIHAEDAKVERVRRFLAAQDCAREIRDARERAQ